ncbi:MAG: NAD(P)/FAD-dependent oxidoreductase [Saprospiraceae bacterium]
MISYWEREYWYPKFDTVIVGSGIVGLTAALSLVKAAPNMKVALIERAELPMGASTKNAGFACFGTIGELLDDLKEQSRDDVVETVRMRWTGLELLKSNVPVEAMDYINQGGYEMLADESQFLSYLDQLDRINGILEEATGHADTIKDMAYSSPPCFYHKAFFNPYESQLNPAKMIAFLLNKLKSAGVTLINGMEILDFEPGPAIHIIGRSGMHIKTSKLLLCTNAFTNRLLDMADIVPARNQVLVSNKLKELPWKGCFHYDRGYVYFRDIDGRILLGGARNIDLEAETTDNFGSNKKVEDHLEGLLRNICPDHEIFVEYRWSGIIASGKSKKPIIRKVDDNIVAAVRLGGMGGAIGSHVGERGAGLILS